MCVNPATSAIAVEMTADYSESSRARRQCELRPSALEGGPATRGSVPGYRIRSTGYDISFGRSQDRRSLIGAEMGETGIAEACRRVEAFDGIPAPPGKTGLTSGERGCLRSNPDLVDDRHRSD
jgi:hypothetical protein